MRIVVGTSPTAIITQQEGARSVVARHRGTDSIYLDTTLTPLSGTGFQLDPGDVFSMDLLPSDVLYAVAASPGQRLDVMKTGV